MSVFTLATGRESTQPAKGRAPPWRGWCGPDVDFGVRRWGTGCPGTGLLWIGCWCLMGSGDEAGCHTAGWWRHRSAWWAGGGAGFCVVAQGLCFGLCPDRIRERSVFPLCQASVWFLQEPCVFAGGCHVEAEPGWAGGGSVHSSPCLSAQPNGQSWEPPVSSHCWSQYEPRSTEFRFPFPFPYSRISSSQ